MLRSLKNAVSAHLVYRPPPSSSIVKIQFFKIIGQQRHSFTKGGRLTNSVTWLSTSHHHNSNTQQHAKKKTEHNAVHNRELTDLQVDVMNHSFPYLDWRKRTVTLTIGYVGSRYHGLTFLPEHQMNGQSHRISSNAGAETDANKNVAADISEEDIVNVNQRNPKLAVQNELFSALCKADLILPSNQHDIRRLRMTQTSRTDKGVHAAMLVMSAKLLVEPPSTEIIKEGLRSSSTPAFYPEVVHRINQHLPAHIRVFCCSANSKKFNAKSEASWRHYSYIIPMELFTRTRATHSDGHQISGSESFNLDAFQQSLKLFEGTHNYTQFTKMHNLRRAVLKKSRQRGDKNSSVNKRSIDSRTARTVFHASGDLISVPVQSQGEIIANKLGLAVRYVSASTNFIKCTNFTKS